MKGESVLIASLLVAIVIAVVAIAWLAVSRAVHRSRFRYTDADITKAREDSVSRSRSTVSGKVQEHLAPFFPDFCSQFNPRDARFLGTPLDFVIFDGLDDGDVRRVVFVEVKTGKSNLQKRERLARDAIESGNVEFQLLRLPDAPPDLSSNASALLDAPEVDAVA